MLYRKITKFIHNHLSSDSDKILLIEGARQVGKSYIIREVGKKLFAHFIELNFVEDSEGAQTYKKIQTIEDFYFVLSSIYGKELGDWHDTLIFLDEIQHYPQYLTWLKFLRQDKRYRFVASGSMLGIAMRHTTSIPVGSIVRRQMYQLDFEEFMIANDVGEDVIEYMHRQFVGRQPLSEALHQRIMWLFRRYLLVGGMPEAVKAYIDTRNMTNIRQVQRDIRAMYLADAAKYEEDFGKRLLIQRIYKMIPSQMENKKKRIVIKDISDKKGDRYDKYRNEFEYLVASGITLAVNAISNPKFPLTESLVKNYVKLYLNDVGLLTDALYRLDVMPILNDESGVNIGAVYESVVAQELKAHGHDLFYYDNRKMGEVDFLIDDYTASAPLPVEVKSGKDYYIHSALDRFLTIKDYGISNAIVLNNSADVRRDTLGIIYMPVYYVMFIDADSTRQEPVII